MSLPSFCNIVHRKANYAVFTQLILSQEFFIRYKFKIFNHFIYSFKKLRITLCHGLRPLLEPTWLAICRKALNSFEEEIILPSTDRSSFRNRYAVHIAFSQ